MSFTKATIDIEPAADIHGGQIECMFNPSELTITKTVSWADKPMAGSQHETSFSGPEPGSFDLQLTFDTTHTGDRVTSYTDPLLKLVEPNDNLPSKSAEKKRPPFVRFSWGRWHSFTAFVQKVSVTFTYFSVDGTPLRANAEVSFHEPSDGGAWPPQNPTSHTPRPHQLHRVVEGERIDHIAGRYYGDPTLWRVIARDNRIDDPARLVVGALLSIPKRGVDAPA